MKKLLGILVLGLLLSGNAYAAETYLVCEKNKKNPVHVVLMIIEVLKVENK